MPPPPECRVPDSEVLHADTEPRATASYLLQTHASIHTQLRTFALPGHANTNTITNASQLQFALWYRQGGFHGALNPSECKAKAIQTWTPVLSFVVSPGPCVFFSSIPLTRVLDPMQEGNSLPRNQLKHTSLAQRQYLFFFPPHPLLCSSCSAFLRFA